MLVPAWPNVDLVYGGATFVSSLVEHGPVDEFYLIVNPIAIGSGMRILAGRTPLTLVDSVAFSTARVNTRQRSPSRAAPIPT
jgi:riboflavin biosynthesis pyrimidine reductase